MHRGIAGLQPSGDHRSVARGHAARAGDARDHHPERVMTGLALHASKRRTAAVADALCRPAGTGRRIEHDLVTRDSREGALSGQGSARTAFAWRLHAGAYSGLSSVFRHRTRSATVCGDGSIGERGG